MLSVSVIIIFLSVFLYLALSGKLEQIIERMDNKKNLYDTEKKEASTVSNFHSAKKKDWSNWSKVFGFIETIKFSNVIAKQKTKSDDFHLLSMSTLSLYYKLRSDEKYKDFLTKLKSFVISNKTQLLDYSGNLYPARVDIDNVFAMAHFLTWKLVEAIHQADKSFIINIIRDDNDLMGNKVPIFFIKTIVSTTRGRRKLANYLLLSLMTTFEELENSSSPSVFFINLYENE